jgi:hypothetical protein
MGTDQPRWAIEREWFVARLSERGFNERTVCTYLGEALKTSRGSPAGHTYVSRILRGERSMKPFAAQIADILGCSIDEIYARAGLARRRSVARASARPSAGFVRVDREGVLTLKLPLGKAGRELRGMRGAISAEVREDSVLGLIVSVSLKKPDRN